MRILETVVILSLIGFISSGIAILYLNFPSDTITLDTYITNVSSISNTSSQFYQNMRYRSEKITYEISEECSLEKQKDFKEALLILEQKTILQFYESEKGEIKVFCSDISPNEYNKDYFVAGEGGPSSVINASRYSVILEGKISFYRTETCKTPQVALHELLHALGFDHNSKKDSIMYPFTNCDQIIDDYIVNEINSIYSQESYADLILESASANKTGQYLSTQIEISNQGLQNVENSSILIMADEKIIKEYTTDELEIGTKRTLSIRNIRIPRQTKEIIFIAKTEQEEITKDNNIAKIKFQ